MTSPELTIRRAGDVEARSIADLWLRSRKASVPANPPTIHTDDEVREWFATVVLPSMDVWVAVQEERIVGLLVLAPGWVEHLHVDPDATGHGVGTALMGVAKDRTPEGLQLWTFVTNTGARRFYEHHGFVLVRGTDGDNEEGAPDVLYEWMPARDRG